MTDSDNAAHVRPGSARTLGLIFATISLLIGLHPLAKGIAPAWGWLALAVVLTTVAVFGTSLLITPTRYWLKLGEALSMLIAPVTVSVVFFALFTPYGLLLRLFGRDSLKLRRHPKPATYWTQRAKADPNHFKQQF